jgi:methylmalonyl-CoA/ethylmalonyl-CoA epimerase
MKPSQIEHIGIAVKSIEKALDFYEGVLGLKCYKIEEVSDQRVKTAFLKIGDTKIELLESIGNDGPIGKFIDKRGEGLHHIAFAVEKIEDHLEHAEALGVTLIDSIPRKGADNMDIAFIHPKSSSGVLIEFCEDKNR